MKYFAAFLVLTMLIPGRALSQRDSLARKHCFTIKTDLLLLGLNIVPTQRASSLTLEAGFKKRHSLQLTGAFITRQPNVRITDLRARLEYKYFWSRKGNFRGFYSGMYLKFQEKSYLEVLPYPYFGQAYINDIYKSTGAGLLSGWQLLCKKHLVIDVVAALGVQYTTRHIVAKNILFFGGPDPYPLMEADGRIALFIGYRF